MKRAYVRPTMVGERFVANEYVAACGDSGVDYKFDCNAGKKGHVYVVKDDDGNVVKIAGYPTYSPCGKKHEAKSDSEFLTGYHIDDMLTLFTDENIPVIIWTDNNTDVHCTTNLNKDSWEKAKS